MLNGFKISQRRAEIITDPYFGQTEFTEEEVRALTEGKSTSDIVAILQIRRGIFSNSVRAIFQSVNSKIHFLNEEYCEIHKKCAKIIYMRKYWCSENLFKHFEVRWNRK